MDHGGEEIIDENCDQLCFLGGIGGLSDCDGIEWQGNAVLEEII